MEQASLEWVHGDIVDGLGQARYALEDFAEGSGSPDKLAECARVLHEVRGVVEMLEFQGLSLLIDEMELLTRALQREDEGRQADGCELLMRGIAQLPEYLGYLRTGHRDNPLVLLPLLNELRGVRGESLYTERALFSPDLWVPLPPLTPPATVPTDEMVREEARKLRPFFQKGLVGWFKGDDPAESIGLIAAAAFRLHRLLGMTAARRLWWIAAGLTAALRKGEVESGTAVKRVVGALDQELKRLADGGLAAAEEPPPADLLRNLLYYLAQANSDSEVSKSIRETFALDELLIDPADREAAAGRLAGTQVDALRTVAEVLKEDLNRVKDSLDTFVRNEHQVAEDLVPHSDVLHRVADTLGLLSLGHSRRAVLDQASAIRRFRDARVPPTHEELMSIARVLLNVDTTLDALAEGAAADQADRALSQPVPARGGVQRFTGVEYLRLLNAVIVECKTDLAAVKDSIATFIAEPEEYERLQEIPDRLHQVEGSLDILSLERARSLLVVWRDYVRAMFLERREIPAPEMLDVLADTVVSIEYYLEAVAQGRGDAEQILDRAESGTAALQAATPDSLTRYEPPAIVDSGIEGLGDSMGEPVAIPPGLLEDLERAKALLSRIDEADSSEDGLDSGSKEMAVEDPPEQPPQQPPDQLPGSTAAESAEHPPGAPADKARPGREEEEVPGADPEIVEIFSEEAEQVIEELAEHLPRWLRDPADGAALIAVRRSFHTLKGSGRMVGATLIGEFAWAIENLLNRVIDRIIPPASSVLAVIERAYEAMPALVASLRDASSRGGGAAIRLENVGAELEGLAALVVEAQALAQPRAHTEEAEDESAGGEPDTADESADILSFPPRHEGWVSPEPEPPMKPGPGGLERSEGGAGLAGDSHGGSSLVETFVEEATHQLESLETLLRGEDSDPSLNRGAAHAPLMRIFHTLHGSARAASMTDIAAICSALETYLLGLRQETPDGGTPRPLGETGLSLIRECVVSLKEAVSELRQSGDGTLAARGALLTRIGVLTEAARGAAPSEPSSEPPPEPSTGLPGGDASEFDVARERLLGAMRDGEADGAWDTRQLSDQERQELMLVFLDEAADILEATEGTLRQWRSAPQSLALVAQIQRELHTLKGGARVAGLAPVGDLSHAVESLLLMVGERVLPVSSKLFDLLEAAYDRLANVLDRARAGEPPGEVDDVIDQMDAFVSPGVADDARPAAAVEIETEGAEILPPTKPAVREERVQIGAQLLDELVNYAGEINITQARVERFIEQFRQNIDEMDKTVERLRDQLRRLEIETESQILFRYQGSEAEENAAFDPLELDRFSDIQELSRALSESVGDLSSIQALLDELTRESESMVVHQGRSNTDLQRSLMQTRLLPFVRLVPRFQRIVRQTAQELGKQVELEFDGEQTQLDRHILNRMRAPLEHMLRNAVDHGIEPPDQRAERSKDPVGKIRVTLDRDGHEVVIDVTDDGRGMDRGAIRERAIARGLLLPDRVVADEELLQFVLEPAFSTADSVTQISGRGVGMDVVNTEIKQLGGTLRITSNDGEGTRFRIRAPFTLAINQALLVNVATEVFALPLMSVEAVVRLSLEEIERLDEADQPTLEHAGMSYPFVPLARLLGLAEGHLVREAQRLPIILVRTGEQRIALLIDELSGRQEVVVKPVGPQLGSIRWIAGATIIGDSRVVLVLDMATVVRMGTARHASGEAARAPGQERSLDGAERMPHRVLVVDDSITVRNVTSRLLTRNGIRVSTANDGVEALEQLRDDLPDLILLDIEMPRMDGFELATEIRKDPRLAELPIIMITSRTGKKHRERAEQIGVQGYLGKPYQEGELLESILEIVAVPSGA